MNFFETFSECSLASTVSKNTTEMIGHHSRLRDEMCPTNQPISAPHFFKSPQMFLLRVKLITQGQKRETSTKTCKETMLCNKLRVFVSRISPPLSKPQRQRQRQWERRQTKGLMSKTVAVHVRCKSLYISLPFSTK